MRKGKRQHEQEHEAEGMIAETISPAEQAVKARELADLCQEIDQKRAAAAADASNARKAIRALESRRRLLAESVRTGTIMVDAQLKFGVVDGDKGRSKRNTSDGNVDA